ncbi:fimbria/pilus outer membrane usher protein [Aeromonas salmonicida]|nr:fimbria/pilus outer membrane usher protein [Aeromonas salmonicida]WGI39586.1 fimbria/pilus outer membrane usher protein [Aeromonas salmonicida]
MKRFTHDADLRGMVVLRSLGFQLVPFKLHRFRKQRRYTGVNLANDERMLPPSLQGYAPEVSGIAKTNAKVTISQSGRIIYETNVPAGPFRIQGLDSSVRGRLDVRVEEQDGSVSSFQVDTGVVAQISQQIMISPAPSDRYTRGFLTGRPRVFSLFIALTYAITSPT